MGQFICSITLTLLVKTNPQRTTREIIVGRRKSWQYSPTEFGASWNRLAVVWGEGRHAFFRRLFVVPRMSSDCRESVLQHVRLKNILS